MSPTSQATAPIERAIYEGHEVIVLARRYVTGGVAVDVRRSERAKDWPWTVSQFTTSARHLTPVAG